MPDFGITTEACRWQQQGMTLDGIDGVLVGFGTSNQKDAWERLSVGAGSTPLTVPFDCAGIIIHTSAYDSGSSSMLIDIGIGDGTDAGTVPIVENLFLGLGIRSQGHNYYFPIGLTAGDIVWVRQQNNNALGVCRFHITYLSGSMGNPSSFGLVRTHGINRATSTGTVLAWGGNGATYGTAQTMNLIRITDLTTPDTVSSQATTLEDYKAFMITVGQNGTFATVKHVLRVLVDDEQLITDVPMSTITGTGWMSSRYFGPFPCSIPAGSTISMAARMSSSAGDLQAAFYGFV